MPDVYLGIAAYNEGIHIRRCLDSLAQQTNDLRPETIICLNGCTDDSEAKVLQAQSELGELRIRVVHSAKGLVHAQRTIIASIADRRKPVLFVDGDVELDRNCVQILHNELHQIPSLMVVGAWPVPKAPVGVSVWEKWLYRILHCRAIYPESEVSAHDVSEFKRYVDQYPQPAVTQEFEKRSKIFFHGRAFMLRDISVFELREDANLIDDTYLPNLLHTEYGPGVIRTRFDARVWYEPYLSLRQHFRSYRRFFLQKAYIDSHCPEWQVSRAMEKCALDWNFIARQGPVVASQFTAYSVLRACEELAFRILPRKDPAKHWQYAHKPTAKAPSSICGTHTSDSSASGHTAPP